MWGNSIPFFPFLLGSRRQISGGYQWSQTGLSQYNRIKHAGGAHAAFTLVSNLSQQSRIKVLGLLSDSEALLLLSAFAGRGPVVVITARERNGGLSASLRA